MFAFMELAVQAAEATSEKPPGLMVCSAGPPASFLVFPVLLAVTLLPPVILGYLKYKRPALSIILIGGVVVMGLLFVAMAIDEQNRRVYERFFPTYTQDRARYWGAYLLVGGMGLIISGAASILTMFFIRCHRLHSVPRHN